MTRDLVVNFLREEGFCPKVDDDGDVFFKCEGRNFLFFCNEEDNDFFQLAMPAIFDVTEDNREMVLEACNAITRSIKVAKCIVIDQQNAVWLLCEMLLDHTPNIEDILPRSVAILRAAQQEFYNAIQ